MATHSNTLAQRIPWTEEPGRLQSIGLQESGMTQQLNRHGVCVYIHIYTHTHIHTHTYIYPFMQCLFEFLPIFNWVVPQSIGAAIIKCHTLGSLKRTFFTVLQARKSKIMVPAWSLSSRLDPPLSGSSSHRLLLCLYV